MARYVTVAKTSEIPPGKTMVVEVDDREILVAHVAGDGFYAIGDICTHDGGPLGEGDLNGATVECPRHGATFDVRDGAALTMPAIVPVPTFPVRVEGDEIQIGVP